MAKKPDEALIKSKSLTKSLKSLIEKTSSSIKKLKWKAAEIPLSPKKKKKMTVHQGHATDTPVGG